MTKPNPCWVAVLRRGKYSDTTIILVGCYESQQEAATAAVTLLDEYARFIEEHTACHHDWFEEQQINKKYAHLPGADDISGCYDSFTPEIVFCDGPLRIR